MYLGLIRYIYPNNIIKAMIYKRGQISIFMILGVIILFLLIFSFDNPPLLDPQIISLEKFSFDSKDIENFYKSCFTDIDINGIDIAPLNINDLKLGQSITKDISQQARYCLDGLKNFEEQGYKIKYGAFTYKILSLE